MMTDLNVELTPEFWRKYVAQRKNLLPRKKISASKKWDKMAKRYQNFAEDKDFVAELKWMKEGMLQRRMLGPELEVIDVSCGPGTHCFSFAELCRQVTALDVSEKMIEQVLLKKDELGVDNLTVICQDFSDFKAPGLYDTVFVSMSPVLNDLDNIDRLLALSRRYLALTYWAGVRENPLYQRCHRLIYDSEYHFDALDLTVVFNYLNALGYSPEISYIHPVWKRRDTLANTVDYIIWHLEFYRRLSDAEKASVKALIAVEADAEDMVSYETRLRKGALFLDKKDGFFEA